MDCGLPGSSIHRILQARILEWVAISFSREIFLTQGLNYIAGEFFTTEPPGKPNHTPKGSKLVFKKISNKYFRLAQLFLFSLSAFLLTLPLHIVQGLSWNNQQALPFPYTITTLNQYSLILWPNGHSNTLISETWLMMRWTRGGGEPNRRPVEKLI